MLAAMDLRTKGREVQGAWLGLLLGVMGVIIIALMPPRHSHRHRQQFTGVGYIPGYDEEDKYHDEKGRTR